MYQTVARQKNGSINKKMYIQSIYQPTREETEVTFEVQKDMQIGRNILMKNWQWFDGRNIIQEMEDNQKRFNSFVPPKSGDPDESWRANTIRPLTRNKIISIAAHVTAQILYPSVFAQNQRDEEDRAAAEVMRDLIEFHIENSEYQMKSVGAVLGALTDPVAVVEMGFAKVMRTVKNKQADGKYELKEIVDEVLSGFVQNYRKANEVYITNAFENNIQKQRAVGIRTLIDYEEAKALYGSNKNFKFVNKGVRRIFDSVTNSFYDVTDPDLIGDFVERVVYRNRYKDLEIVFINGVIVTEPDKCIDRGDKLYGLASFGYEFINNGNFFYYKSAVNKLSKDQDTIDTMYNMVIDGTFPQIMPPMALFGSEEVTSSMVIPGTITSFKDKDTKFESIAPRMDLRAGMESINLMERSMSESSQDQFQAGVLTPGERTAQEISTLQANAKTNLGLFGKMIQNFVKQTGYLMVGDIIQYTTLGEVEELTNGETAMKFKSVVVKNKIVDGKKVSKKIRFTDKYYEKPEPTSDDLLKQSIDLYDEEEKLGGEMVIMDVNPELFRKNKYMMYVGSDFMEDKSEALLRALDLQAYDRLIQNPVIASDPESMRSVTQDFLIETFAPGESYKYMPKPAQEQPQSQTPTLDQEMAAKGVQASTPNQFTQKGVNSNLLQQITGSDSMKAGLS